MLETTQLTCLVTDRQIKPRGRAIWGQSGCFGLQGGAYEIFWIVRSAVGGGASHRWCQGSRGCSERTHPDASRPISATSWHSNTGVLTDALASAAIDVAFMPVDEERKKRLEFGPAYCLVESTYMVTAASGIRTLAEVDRPGVRVVGIANTTTIRAAGRSLINTVPIAATSIDDAVAMLRAGQADAFALGRDSLPSFVAEFPGSHIVDGGFQQTGIAIAVPKGHPKALAYVTKFIEDAKASGSVRRAMDRAGMANLAVAPPER